ncbi:hypothetical protein GCM10009122_23050 [Fulvivirga kasyanovii]|uniref:Uncharacterized protein n=1 Tax=Fulvivirga kasyanovii TaxID=396812 RepID=A0ABW9RXN4_9BACT|nr:hypothetical protein [Fulvivirga kasyanovii]MTI28988.1 hypothetical protein [Fulvivirga kasyanovii]
MDTTPSVEIGLNSYLPGEWLTITASNFEDSLTVLIDNKQLIKFHGYTETVDLPYDLSPETAFNLKIVNEKDNTTHLDTTFMTPKFTTIAKIIDKEVGQWYGATVVLKDRSFLDSARYFSVGGRNISLPLESDTIELPRLSLGSKSLGLEATFDIAHFKLAAGENKVSVLESYMPLPINSDMERPDTLAVSYFSSYAPDVLSFTLVPLNGDPIPLEEFTIVPGRKDFIDFYQAGYLIEDVLPGTYTPIVVDPEGDTLITEKYHTVTIY